MRPFEHPSTGASEEKKGETFMWEVSGFFFSYSNDAKKSQKKMDKPNKNKE
jgi:hypothetical protein